MNPAKLHSFLVGAINNKRRVLVKGAPGIGKSDIVCQAAKTCNADVILMHPSISDPTDFKGMPALTAGGSEAHFLPFGDLSRLCKAQKPTVAFLDDIGQAAPAVQAALMQLILARSVNGTRISDQVTFLGATNDTTHMAGVSGMIEPLKSRWDTIIELQVSCDDLCSWGLDNGISAEMIAFWRFRPALISAFKPCREISNSPSPRGWKSVDGWLQAGVTDNEVFIGAVGEGAATEFTAFLGMYKDLPSLDAILLDPKNAPVPSKPAQLFAVASGLARKASPNNFERVTTYLARLPKEYDVCSVRDAVRITKAITSCPAFVTWATRNKDVLI